MEGGGGHARGGGRAAGPLSTLGNRLEDKCRLASRGHTHTHTHGHTHTITHTRAHRPLRAPGGGGRSWAFGVNVR